MSTFEIRVVDPADESRLKPWWVAAHETNTDRPYDAYPGWEVTRARLTADDPEHDITLLAAYDGDEVVGTAELWFGLKDNLHLAELELLVPPRHRRRGAGTALLNDVERRIKEAGRTHLVTAAPSLPGADSDGTHFAAARGFANAHFEELKNLDLTQYGDGLDALAAEQGDLDGYRIVTFGVWAPDELVDGVCGLLSDFMDDVPLGELAFESSTWTPERLRAAERRREERGKVIFSAAAIAPDGAVAGLSDVGTTPPETTKAEIGLTMVGREHRGHGLGLAMKLATHRELRAAYPECQRVETGNAGVNQHMNAINERMGYRIVEDFHEYQKVL
ncbi:GNAT family N-acetyltransferase [Nocardioides speluncae]|uniref:GNAT family N-acetyltransferase n=1 Tax=Nocardioides speluncae TaxID=2670337 RepID=UPI001379A45D|nr:GNAT family N-acetyltransferase [Nocardioides speluncae]